MSELVPIILDNGSSFSKAGFAGNDAPHVLFPTVTAKHKVSSLMIGLGSLDTFVGDYAIGRRGAFIRKYPIERGLITDWDNMEKIWNYTFYNEIRVSPEECKVLLMESPLNPKSEREMMAKVSLLASGKTTGLALESGDAVTSSVPVYEGIALPDATLKLELGGKDLTDSLKKILVERGYLFTPSEIDIVKEMKEKLCYVASNFQEESKKGSLLETEFELPDGNLITIGSERFRTPEILFEPHIIGMEVGGIHENIATSIRKCDVDIRKEMYSNIVLSGGSTMFDGIVGRLSHELQEISPSIKNRIIALPERNYHAWIGGSIFASMSTFNKVCIRREEYDEIGPNILHRN